MGIDLASGAERELFRWFVACLLFGKPIQREVAGRAYAELAGEGLITCGLSRWLDMRLRCPM